MLVDLIKAAEAVLEARGSTRIAFDNSLEDLAATVQSVKGELGRTHDFLAQAQGIVKAFWAHPQQQVLGRPSPAQMQGFSVLLAVKMREAASFAAQAQYYKSRSDTAERNFRKIEELLKQGEGDAERQSG